MFVTSLAVRVLNSAPSKGHTVDRQGQYVLNDLNAIKPGPPAQRRVKIRVRAKPPLRCDRRRVDVLIEAASDIEASGGRARAGAAGLRVAGHVRPVIIGGGVGRPNRVPLVGPRCTDCVPLGGHGDVVTEERHPASAELLIVEVRRRVGYLDARSPSLTAVSGVGVPDVQARRLLPRGAVTRRPDGRVVRIPLRVVPDGVNPATGCGKERIELVPGRARREPSWAAPGSAAVGGKRRLDLPLAGGLGYLERHDQRPVDVVGSEERASQIKPRKGKTGRAGKRSVAAVSGPIARELPGDEWRVTYDEPGLAERLAEVLRGGERGSGRPNWCDTYGLPGDVNLS